jgi:type II secretory pathway pseudopilin PulG
MSKKTNNETGFTLVGVLVAALILAVVAIAASGIFSSALSTANIARHQFIAVNIAREGLELVHALRDTNWFTQDDRSHWLDHGLCTDGFNQFTDTNRQFTISPADLQNLNNVHTDSDGAITINGQPTPFTRLMSIDCSHKDDAAPFVTVISTVSWEDNNRPHSVVLKETLFNWLPTQLKLNP